MTLLPSKSATSEGNRKVSGPLALLVLFTNLVPILGVLYLGWDAFSLVLVFWLETVVVGYFNVLKMRQARVSPLSRPMPLPIPFFIVHYGMFTLGHLIFLIGFFLQSRSVSGFLQTLADVGFGVTVLFMVLEHAYEYWLWIDQTTPDQRPTAQEQMFKPYGRIIITHLGIFAGAFLTTRMPEPTAILIAIVVLKTILDLGIGIVQMPDTGVSARIKAVSVSLLVVPAVVFGLCMLPVAMIGIPVNLVDEFLFQGALGWPKSAMLWGLALAAGVSITIGFLVALYEALKGVPGFGPEPTWWKVLPMAGTMAFGIYWLVPFADIWAWVREPRPRPIAQARPVILPNSVRPSPLPPAAPKRTGPGTDNLMRRATLSASSTNGMSFAPTGAADGDRRTRWNSRDGDATTAWLAAHWEKPTTVHKLIMRQAHDRIIHFVIDRFDDARKDWVPLVHVFCGEYAVGMSHYNSYSATGDRPWGMRRGMVNVDGLPLEDQKTRVFGNDHTGESHPVFTIVMPEPVTTSGLRFRVATSTAPSVGIFEWEAY